MSFWEELWEQEDREREEWYEEQEALAQEWFEEEQEREREEEEARQREQEEAEAWEAEEREREREEAYNELAEYYADFDEWQEKYGSGDNSLDKIEYREWKDWEEMNLDDPEDDWEDSWNQFINGRQESTSSKPVNQPQRPVPTPIVKGKSASAPTVTLEQPRRNAQEYVRREAEEKKHREEERSQKMEAKKKEEEAERQKKSRTRNIILLVLCYLFFGWKFTLTAALLYAGYQFYKKNQQNK